MKPKTSHKIAFSALSLLVAIFIAGFLYVYFTDQSSTAIPLNKTAEKYTPLPHPKQPASNAPEGVAVEALDTPVAPGSNTSMIINTNSGSVCSIIVSYNDVISKDSGLVPKKADGYGNITWSWTVPATAPIGNWPIKVSCVFNGHTGVDISNLQVAVQ